MDRRQPGSHRGAVALVHRRRQPGPRRGPACGCRSSRASTQGEPRPGPPRPSTAPGPIVGSQGLDVGTNSRAVHHRGPWRGRRGPYRGSSAARLSPCAVALVDRRRQPGPRRGDQLAGVDHRGPRRKVNRGRAHRGRRGRPGRSSAAGLSPCAVALVDRRRQPGPRRGPACGCRSSRASTQGEPRPGPPRASRAVPWIIGSQVVTVRRRPGGSSPAAGASTWGPARGCRSSRASTQGEPRPGSPRASRAPPALRPK